MNTRSAWPISPSAWLLGDAVGHIREMALHNNHAENNSGIFLIAEIVTPVVILILAMYHRARTPDGQER